MKKRENLEKNQDYVAVLGTSKFYYYCFCIVINFSESAILRYYETISVFSRITYIKVDDSDFEKLIWQTNLNSAFIFKYLIYFINLHLYIILLLYS